MEKILVCVNDGLLKIRLNRILSEKHHAFTITDNPIKRSDLLNYSLLIVHTSYKLVNLTKFIENVIINKLATVVYITSNPASNQFIKFRDNENLILIDENKLDVELNLAIEIYKKLTDKITSSQAEIERLNMRLEEEKTMIRCKRLLMEKGLSETESHQEILKYAMDNRLSKTEACKRLISMNND